jgi:2'-5' RNA ligase
MATTPGARESRLFFALPVDARLATSLAPLADAVAQQTGGRAVPQANLHATLAFLGSVAHAALPRLRAIGAALPQAALDVALDTLGGFGHAQVAWIGAARVPQPLVDLHASLNAALAADGFATETRPYHLHVTLARHCRRPLRRTTVAPLAWRVDRIVLFESVTAGAGPRYDALETWALATA